MPMGGTLASVWSCYSVNLVPTPRSTSYYGSSAAAMWTALKVRASTRSSPLNATSSTCGSKGLLVPQARPNYRLQRSPRNELGWYIYRPSRGPAEPGVRLLVNVADGRSQGLINGADVALALDSSERDHIACGDHAVDFC